VRADARVKLILSRKGFDSQNGGVASPILDGGLCSLPIPDRNSGISYDQINWRGADVGRIVAQLTNSRVTGSDRAHLDPDLRRESIERMPGWRAIFGQADAAQGHLRNQNVGVGDLFLFFGYFRQAEWNNRHLNFVPRAPEMHVIYGWMQIGEMIAVTKNTAKQVPWAEYHPHLTEPTDRYKSNTLYVASDRLSSLDLDAPGAGTFPACSDDLILSKPGGNCSQWRLPRWFFPDGLPALSYHRKKSRWLSDENGATLQSVGKGQEFVLDLAHYPQAIGWLRGLFNNTSDV
jgi:hypothetical protein